MVHANKIQIAKYKSEYIIKLIGVYIRQKCTLAVDNISTKMSNVNGENFKTNYININHLFRLYDTLVEIISYAHVKTKNVMSHLGSYNSTATQSLMT